ncbi:MAG TPA: hypothetical protein VFI37_14190 [Gaiellaceae bacterium]|nr:hypothetical protein [Gaiellaceae bacterium]
MPGRRVPLLAGTLIVLLGLPVFLAAGWSLAAWVLAAVLWAAGEAFAAWVGRLPLGADNLVSSGIAGVAMTFRSIGVMVVLIAVTLSDRSVGIPAAALYILAYSVELATSLVSYFGGEKK